MMRMLRAAMGLLLACATLILGAGTVGKLLPSRELLVGANYRARAHGLHVVEVERGLSVPLVLGLRGGLVTSANGGVAFAEQAGNIYTVDTGDGSEHLSWVAPAFTVMREMVWSPDGTTMAFIVSQSSDANADFEYNLYLLRGAETRLMLSSDDYWSFGGIAWSADGTRIALTANDGPLEMPEIAVLDVASGATRQASPDTIPSAGAVWSPDGTQIAFQGYIGFGTDIYLINADGSDVRNLTRSPAGDALPRWSPDGTRVAFVSYEATFCRLYVVNSDGSDLRLLKEYQSMTAFDATWSPDGRQIALELQGTAFPFQSVDIINVDGSGERIFTSDDYSLYSAIWLP